MGRKMEMDVNMEMNKGKWLSVENGSNETMGKKYRMRE